MNLGRVVLVFAALPVVVAAERFAYYAARSLTAIHATQELALSHADLGRLLTVPGLAMIFALLVGGALGALSGPAPLIVLGLVLCTAGHALAAVADSSGALMLGLVVGAIGQGLFRPGLYTLAAVELTGPREALRSAAFVALYAAVNVGALVAPPLASSMSTGAGTEVGFVLGAVASGIAAVVALLVALLWWFFRPEHGEPRAALDAPRVLASALGLLALATLFQLLASTTWNLQFAKAASGTYATVALAANANPVGVIVTAAIAIAAMLVLHFMRVGVSALYFVAAGLVLAATATLPLLLGSGNVTTNFATSAALGVAEVVFMPFALSRAAGDAPRRSVPAIFGVWFAVTYGAGLISNAIGGWLVGHEALPVALLAGVCFLLGTGLFVAARRLSRLLYEPSA